VNPIFDTPTPATSGTATIERLQATAQTSGTKGTPTTAGMPAAAGTEATGECQNIRRDSENIREVSIIKNASNRSTKKRQQQKRSLQEQIHTEQQDFLQGANSTKRTLATTAQQSNIKNLNSNSNA
jgi:hypothetical protein